MAGVAAFVLHSTPDAILAFPSSSLPVLPPSQLWILIFKYSLEMSVQWLLCACSCTLPISELLLAVPIPYPAVLCSHVTKSICRTTDSLLSFDFSEIRILGILIVRSVSLSGLKPL